MTDTDTNAGSMLRDAGGARPASEFDALIGRLRVRATKDIAAGWDGDARDRDEVADALIQLREENARLKDCFSAREVRALVDRIAALEGERDHWREANRQSLAAGDALKVYADRYFWLREQAGKVSPQASTVFRKGDDWANVWDGLSLDAAIDAAREKP